MIIADPKPVRPRHMTMCHSSVDTAIISEPASDATIPSANTRSWPNRSPIRAPSSTKLPSINRYTVTIQAVSSKLASNSPARVGSDKATGMLESCTSMYAAVTATNTSRRLCDAMRGLIALSIALA